MLDEPEQLGRERRLRERQRRRRGRRVPAARRRRRRPGRPACRRCGRRPSCTAPASTPLSEAHQPDGRLAVVRAAALLEQRRLLRQRRIAVHLQQLALDLGDRSRRAARPSAARRAPRRARRSSAGSTTAPRRARRAASAAGRRRPPARRRARRAGRRSTSSPSSRTARTHVRWLRPTWSTSTRPGSTPSMRANVPLEADRHVAEADRAVAGVEQRARDDPDRVREVDDPRAGADRSATRSAMSSTTGTVRIALAKPPAPVVSCPMQPQASGTVSSCSRAAWPPTRIWSSTKSAPSTARSRSPVMVSSPANALRSSIRRASPPTTSQPLGVDVVQHELVDAQRRRGPDTSSGVYVEPPPMTATFTPSPPSASRPRRTPSGRRRTGRSPAPSPAASPPS